jgi:DNA/RNA-binding domain of Phe-tRNA-synthetase-like protein
MYARPAARKRIDRCLFTDHMENKMSRISSLESYIEAAHVADDVFALRPDYRVLLMAVDGVEPGPGDEQSESLLRRAERMASDLLTDQPVDQVPHIAAWRDAYRSFGAKPQRTRNSLEALTRRAPTGLPRINRLTDVYNALSIIHQIPLGGEDLERYAGPPRLIRAIGNEPFDTSADGVDCIEHPVPGEVVWCDDAGVTCRLWNWRQARRTQLQPETTSALFIFDALDPLTDDELNAAGDELIQNLKRSSPDLVSVRRVIRQAAPDQSPS